jgi:hypothetical protein
LFSISGDDLGLAIGAEDEMGVRRHFEDWLNIACGQTSAAALFFS